MHRQQQKIHSEVETSCVSLQNPTFKNYGHGVFPRSIGNEEALNFQRLT